MAYEKIESHDEYLKVVEQYDEDGDDLDTSDDYEVIRDEFLGHPEQFALNNILDFMEMLDDGCHQPSYMDVILKIIHNIVRFYQREGATYLLSHLREVPGRGYVYGLFWNIRYLIKDDSVYPFIKEALGQISPDDREFVLQILKGTDMPDILGSKSETGKFSLLSECGDEIERNRKAELEDIISRLPD